ncbi:MAG TPA: carboxyl transferase domain-containing protein [Candidatus Dormibacteraeota bacterium]|nr:carboxyl transferase domain-containing protein [Candidatus Dormibacteraeota bacterium]
MPCTRLLVANRGEIAIRIMRSAAELGVATVAVFSEDDAAALHRLHADQARALRGVGPAAYLDAEQLIAVARDAGCDALHPGYGFLAEQADFARRCAVAGLTFVGPRPDALALLGDKPRARALAEQAGVPVLAGSGGPVSLDEARAFLARLGGAPVVIKAVAGGGGRGMRVVADGNQLAAAYARCRSEAGSAFGDDRVYVEQLLPRARHLEVQVVGDGRGGLVQLGERECTLQRRHQKLIELAPSPSATPALRERLWAAALRLAAAAAFDGIGTFEFLVDATAPAERAACYFIEANPRLQVEHTVTEAVTGLDLVAIQLGLAAGRSLAELGIAGAPLPRGLALQARVNMETITADGTVKPSGGTLTAFEVPSGPGVRVDTCAYAGWTPSPRFDSLLAKVVVHVAGHDVATLIDKAYRTLAGLRVEGLETNLGFLQTLLCEPDVRTLQVTTDWIDARLGTLAAADADRHPRRFFAAAAADAAATASAEPVAPPGTVAVRAPLQGTVVSIEAAAGAAVRAGQPLLVMEAMKMEHVVAAPASGTIVALTVAAGDAVREHAPLAFLAAGAADAVAAVAADDEDPAALRDDLAEALERHAVGLDARRPEAVARRRRTGQRTARENVDDLCDPGSFAEYGALALAAQRSRRTLDDLIARTPGDGLVGGIGTVNAARVDPARSRCVVMTYDYTVLAGTQGFQNHRKKDRLFELAERLRLPVVLFAEGGGGRPGDTDAPGVSGLDCLAFQYFGQLSGLVPLVGIVSGRCFAGNAALLGCCDVVVATRGANIGMGGPAMIEGGGLGVFRPEEVGPLDVQEANGVVDVAVADEAEAVRVAKQYLSYFQGPLAEWTCPDQRRLRTVVPANRLRVYDVRRAIDGLADSDSVLELRRGFGAGMVTALARVEGRPLGIIANNPMHLAGAIDRDGADKATRFMQLCDAFDLPLVFLCDTPGIMVGPAAETTALVRHAARMFVVGASLSVPFCTVILRKGYGLGAQAMAGGSFKAPLFTVSWPSGEFGGMGLEGAVRLGFRNELAKVEDEDERQALFEKMVARAYEIGKAVNVASHFEIDDVIDPADTRRWISTALAAAPPPPPRTGKKRPCVDPW